MSLEKEYLSLKNDLKTSLSFLLGGVEDTAIFPHEISKNITARESYYAQKQVALGALEIKLQNCTKCALHIGRTKLVFGTGNPDAEICFVGGSISSEENQTGQTLTGENGQLFLKILSAMNLRRENIYFLNIVKCKAPGNHVISSDDVNQCNPFFIEQMKIISPKIIVCLGDLAARTLLRTEASVAALRDKIHFWQGIKCFVTYHPETLRLQPDKKRPAWQDFQLVIKHLTTEGEK